MWLAETQKNKDHLDSKDFEGMIYTQFIPQIERIVEEELGYKPDIRRNSLMDFETFKEFQRKALALISSGKEMDEHSRTAQKYLSLMRQDVTAGLLNPEYNLEARTNLKTKLMEKHGTDEEGVKQYLFPMYDRLRDRLAAEIPLLAK